MISFHLLTFNFKRMLTLWRTHIMMALMLIALAGTSYYLASNSRKEEVLLAAVSMFCGSFIVFNSLLLVSLLAENIFFLEKHNGIMEAIFSAPVGPGVVLVTKALALAAVSWAYPILVLSSVFVLNGRRFLGILGVPHLVLLLCVMPVFLFACSIIVGIFLSLSTDIRIKNIVSSVLLFAVMGLSNKIIAISAASGFWPIVQAYAFIALLLLGVSILLFKTIYTKTAVLDASYR